MYGCVDGTWLWRHSWFHFFTTLVKTINCRSHSLFIAHHNFYAIRSTKSVTHSATQTLLNYSLTQFALLFKWKVYDASSYVVRKCQFQRTSRITSLGKLVRPESSCNKKRQTKFCGIHWINISKLFSNEGLGPMRFLSAFDSITVVTSSQRLKLTTAKFSFDHN